MLRITKLKIPASVTDQKFQTKINVNNYVKKASWDEPENRKSMRANSCDERAYQHKERLTTSLRDVILKIYQNKHGLDFYSVMMILDVSCFQNITFQYVRVAYNF